MYGNIGCMIRKAKRKVTLVLEADVADGIKQAVESGRARSQSGLVQEAVVEYLAHQQREAMRAAYAEASRDPSFLRDVEQVRRDFEPLDAQLEIE